MLISVSRTKDFHHAGGFVAKVSNKELFIANLFINTPLDKY
jgi:hypothetical protein